MVAAPQKPLMLCVPAAASKVSDSDWNKPAPWPAQSTIRVKVLPNQVTYDIILTIIRRTASQWLTGHATGIGTSIKWVSENENADIRISFRPDQPNWSCVGMRARDVDQSAATMNFSFGNWKENSALYPHSYIIRLAAHLFGHALGLPHASASWSSGWDDAQLATKYGQSIAARMSRESGCTSLKRPDSIMRFDRPASLTGRSDDLKGGSQIDDEARTLLLSLYPPYRDILCWILDAEKMPNFSRYENNHMAGCGRERLWYPFTSNAVTGLCHLDIRNDENYRVTSSIHSVQANQFVEVEQGAWDRTYLYNSRCRVLGFAESDERVQTGTFHLRTVAQGNLNTTPGWKFSLGLQFNRPFRTTPNVVAWYAAFDTKKEHWIRLKVSTRSVSRVGFTFDHESWDNTIVYDFRIYWLAHESDDPTIRSGTFNFPPHMSPNVTEDRSWVQYSSPMAVKPRYMFTAFNHIDVSPSANIRLTCETPQWNENAVEGRCSTWVQESKYCQLSGVYIAIA